MTKQETFDTVARGLLKQGRQSIDPMTGWCAYRYVTEDGVTLKCAAGMLIPDEKYDPMFEGFGIVPHPMSYDSWRVCLKNIITGDGHDIWLVRELQEMHDGWEKNITSADHTPWHEHLVTGLTAIAELNGLSSAVLREQG